MAQETYAAIRDQERASLCDVLDRVLNTGVTLAGEIVISVADIDLIYLDLRLLLSSVKTIQEMQAARENIRESKTEWQT